MIAARSSAAPRRLWVLAGVMWCLLQPMEAPGSTFYVRERGDDLNNGLTPETAWRSVNTAAHRLSASGDVVIVGPGRYLEGDIDPVVDGTPTSPVKFLGDPTGSKTGDPPGPVIIDAAHQHERGFLIFGRHDVVISGFYITNAVTAGVQVRPNVKARGSNRIVVENNVIFSNGNGRIGRGVQVRNADDVVVFNNLIYANSSVGVSVGGTAPGSNNARIINNTIYDHRFGGVVVGEGTGSQSPGAWVINNIIAASGQSSVDVNVPSRCDYVGAYNLVTDAYSATTPRDPTDINAVSPFVHPEGPDGMLGGTGFADDDFSLPQGQANQRNSPAVDAGADSATVFGLTQSSTRRDGAADTGRVDLGFHRGSAEYPGFTPIPIPPQTLYVRASGSDSNDGQTPARALRSLAQASLIARANSTILVGPGAYLESNVGLGPLVPAGPVTFVADPSGEQTGDLEDPVLIDAGGDSNAFLVTGRCSTVIDGFAVTGSSTAGIQFDTASKSVARNNIVFSNGRRGIEVDDSDHVQVINNLVYANASVGITVGGGMPGGCAEAPPSRPCGSRYAVLRNNTLYQNGDKGIAIGAGGETSPGARVEYNILSNNGALDNHKGIQVGDAPQNGADPSLRGYVAQYNINTDRYANGTPQPDTDLVSDPLFVNPAGPDGVLGGDGFADDDFRLSQVAAGQTVTSPAVDYGQLTVKSAGLVGRSTRTDGAPDTGRVDLGYHYPAQVVAALFVSPNGSDTNSGFSQSLPLQTIGEALKRASSGMQVRLASGSYAESGLRPKGGVTIVGSSTKPAHIDAGGASTVFDVRDANVTIIDVGITGAGSAGVRVRSDGLQLINCHVFSNPGKGILLESGRDAVLFNNLVYSNGGTGLVVGNSNSAPSNGTIVQNTIYGNGGFGITVGVGNPPPPPATQIVIVNNILTANRREGFNVGAGSLSGMIVSHNCNSDGYVGIAQAPSDISADPLLVTSSGEAASVGTASGEEVDVFLSQIKAGQAAESPCVDAGLGTLDELGLEQTSTRTDRFPDRGWVDIGYHAQLPDSGRMDVAGIVRACAEGCNDLPGDCNGDKRVTVDEIVLAVDIAVGGVPLSSCPGLDRNGDGAVTVDELLLALESALAG